MINIIKKFFSSIVILEYKETKVTSEMIRKILSKKSNQNWLDVGCGSTPYKKFFKGNKYTGIDIERKGYGQAKKLVDKFYDGKTIPFDNEIFDGAICTQVLGVCDDEISLVKEINRILKKDGYFVVATPFIYREVEKPYDFRRFTSFGIEKLLADNDFEVIENKKILSALETIGMLLSNYISNHTSPKILRRAVNIFLCFPIQILFSCLSFILPDNKDLFCTSVVLAKKTKKNDEKNY